MFFLFSEREGLTDGRAEQNNTQSRSETDVPKITTNKISNFPHKAA